jgi:hypothetical protein
LTDALIRTLPVDRRDCARFFPEEINDVDFLPLAIDPENGTKPPTFPYRWMLDSQFQAIASSRDPEVRNMRIKL